MCVSCPFLARSDKFTQSGPTRGPTVRVVRWSDSWSDGPTVHSLFTTHSPAPVLFADSSLTQPPSEVMIPFWRCAGRVESIRGLSGSANVVKNLVFQPAARKNSVHSPQHVVRLQKSKMSNLQGFVIYHTKCVLGCAYRTGWHRQDPQT